MNQRIVSFLFGFFTFLIYYNTLIPFSFDYSVADLPQLLNHIDWVPELSGKRGLSLTDVVGNIFLFIPFGFLLYMLLNYRGKLQPILTAIFFGALVSLSVEFIQLFIQSRNTAPHDIINNVLGSWLGAIFGGIYSHRVSALSRRIFYDLLDRKPFLLIVVIIGFTQFVAALMPFTVSITFSHVVDSIKSTNLIPFSYHSLGAIFRDAPNQHDLEPFDWTPMLSDMIFWAVIGYLLMICYRIYWKKKSYGKLLLWALPLLYFPLLEACQMFIIKRITDINDVLSGYLGFAIGYGLYLLLRPIRRKTFNTELDLLKIPLLIYGIFILFSGLRPFDWSINPFNLAPGESVNLTLFPFYSYFKKTSFWNIYDLVNSLTFFLPFSLYWSFVLKEKGYAYSRIYILTTLSGLAAGTFIEIVQLFSVARVSDITDALAYASGGAIGTFMIYYYEKQVVPNLNLVRQGILKLA